MKLKPSPLPKLLFTKIMPFLELNQHQFILEFHIANLIFFCNLKMICHTGFITILKVNFLIFIIKIYLIVFIYNFA